MITLRQLQALAALAETGSFHAAAARTLVTQPALSTQIRNLEAELGQQLVERSRKGVVFTTAGHEALTRAREILRQVEDLRSVVRTGRKPLSGVVRIGTLPTVGPYLLPHILPTMRARYPDLRLFLRERDSDDLFSELAGGELDVLVVSLPAAPGDTVVAPVFREPLYVAMPRGHDLAGHESLAPADLGGRLVILLDRSHRLRDHMLEVCIAANAAEHPDFRATSLDTLRQMTATGVGLTLLPGLYVLAEAFDDAQIHVRPFHDPPPARDIALVWRRTSDRQDEFRLLADMVRAEVPRDIVTVLGEP